MHIEDLERLPFEVPVGETSPAITGSVSVLMKRYMWLR